MTPTTVGQKAMYSKKKPSSIANCLMKWQSVGTDKLTAICDVIDQVIGQNGFISQVLSNSEHRPQQVEMAKIVAQVLVRDKQTSIIEAPTGSGKSLAYLVPSVPASLMKTEPIIISTSTKNLQTQLSEKDLPLLKKIFLQEFGVDFSFAVCKGRGNYLCLRRLYRMLDLRSSKKKKQRKKGKNVEIDMFQDEPEAITEEWEIAEKRNIVKANYQTKEEREAFDLLMDWYQSTPTIGDSFEFGQEVGKGAMASIWSEVCGEADECLSWKCDYAKHCYFTKAKKEWETAQICIVNHALFFANKMIEGKGGKPSLPKSKYVIFDEADHVADAAKKFQGTEVTSTWLPFMLNKISKHSTEKGCLFDVLLARAGGNLVTGLQTLSYYITELISASNAFYTNIEKEYLADSLYLKRYKEPLRCDATKIIQYIEYFIDLATDSLDWHINAKDEVKIMEATSIMNGLSRHKDELLKLVKADKVAEECYFIERQTKLTKQGGHKIKLKSVPIDISQFLKTATKDMYCCYTSATLASDVGLKYFGETVGIDVSNEKVKAAILPSPFNYEKNCLIYTPDMPLPNNGQLFNQKTIEQILTLEPMIDGGIFVLFTSYSSMMEVVNAVRPTLENRGRSVFVQGIDGVKDKIVTRFRAAKNGVLFGVSSFWVGVDIQGKALSCVVIVKMPFERPDDPINEATREYLTNKGKSYFKDYDLPKATMMIRQGFGRLIRTKTDYGVVVILDPRLNEWSKEKKFYARTVMTSLPTCRQVCNIREVENFLLGRKKDGHRKDS